jgi:predicted TIM-barrel fold metal-dependent hydrolase
MMKTNPERLVWGSDWPHLQVTPTPDAAKLLAMFKEWAGSGALADQVLRINPESLYR